MRDLFTALGLVIRAWRRGEDDTLSALATAAHFVRLGYYSKVLPE